MPAIDNTIGTAIHFEALEAGQHRIIGADRCLGDLSDDKWGPFIEKNPKRRFEAIIAADLSVTCPNARVAKGLERRLRAKPDLLSPGRVERDLGFTFKLA